MYQSIQKDSALAAAFLLRLSKRCITVSCCTVAVCSFVTAVQQRFFQAKQTNSDERDAYKPFCVSTQVLHPVTSPCTYANAAFQEEGYKANQHCTEAMP